MGFLNTIFGGSQRPPPERKEPVLAQSLENPSTPLSDIGNWSEFLGLPGTVMTGFRPPVSARQWPARPSIAASLWKPASSQAYP